MSRVLHAYIGEKHIGMLIENAGAWSFEYSKAWQADPEAYALSPALQISRERITDNATRRPVQWYFDNLLPEESARQALARNARIQDADAFSLLAHYGAESAGSLTLLVDQLQFARDGYQTLDESQLSARIRNMKTVPLIATAPKKMSMAGAQHKLGVVYHRNTLLEPVGVSPSTHLLKPDHEDAQVYPHSVINEYFTCRLARAVGLSVPDVHRLYVPEPAYLIRRFDREGEGKSASRKHAIDACQLLNFDRGFKYTQSSIETLNDIANRCTNKVIARLSLYQWVVFNLLVGNSDAHLKNLSFLVDRSGFRLAPHYDLLCTSIYESRLPGGQDDPLKVDLPWDVDGAQQFADVTPATLDRIGETFGIAKPTARRIVEQMTWRIESEAGKIIDEIARENQGIAAAKPQAGATLASELTLLQDIQTRVIQAMIKRLSATRKPIKSQASSRRKVTAAA